MRATETTEVFADTSAIYTLLDRDELRQGQVAEAFRKLAGTTTLITHSYVRLETLALVQRRLGMAVVRIAIQDVFPALTTVWVAENLHRSAETALVAASRRNVSLVDWVSFEFMRRHGLSRAFAIDDDFVEQGFETVP